MFTFTNSTLGLKHLFSDHQSNRCVSKTVSDSEALSHAHFSVIIVVFTDGDSASILQVEEEMEKLKETYRRRPEEVRSPQKEKLVDVCWQETLRRFNFTQDLGNRYVHAVTTVTRPIINQVFRLIWR